MDPLHVYLYVVWEKGWVPNGNWDFTGMSFRDRLLSGHQKSRAAPYTMSRNFKSWRSDGKTQIVSTEKLYRLRFHKNLRLYQ
ncbi:unnamed protein product [Allacma fusca]|uniref:Uncharacterized protein n=1 Tax=Allacma fusca TaxID=39272 RepID=A0A8J2JIH3_9HEXA|nr:unnamed protein product [Allacma fusca]